MSAPTSYPFYPNNDFAITVSLKDVDLTTGSLVPLTTGTVTGFIATSNLPTATAADASLTFTGTNLGNGKWLVAFDAGQFDPTLLNSLFGTNPSAFIIIQQTGNVRVYVPLTYYPSRPGILT